MVLMIPTLPLLPPLKTRAVIAIGKLRLKPQNKLVHMVTKSPIKMTGLRPKRSDALPHATAVTHCDSENTAEVMPAHRATLTLSMPNDSIISGWYMVSEMECRRMSKLPSRGTPRSKL